MRTSLEPSVALGRAVYDVVVVGAGFGGLGAALGLGERGARVALCEALRYPGGCAATFTRGAYRFDAGATLLSGLGESEPLGRVVAAYTPLLRLDSLDPIVEFRGDYRRPVWGDKARFLEEFFAYPGAPVKALRRFFDLQQRVSDALWSLLLRTDLLPPFDARALWHHVSHVRDYVPLVRLVGRSLRQVLETEGLATFQPLLTWANAVCQITLQCSLDVAEAPFALAALDYYFRGTRHVHGGVGEVAASYVRGLAHHGVDVYFSNRVGQIACRGALYDVHTRRGVLQTRAIVANVQPSVLASWASAREHPLSQLGKLERRQAPLDDAWGAQMRYVGLHDHPSLPEGAYHLQLVDRSSDEFIEGNHVFVSVSGRDEKRAPPGQRVATLSTHVSLRRASVKPADYAEHVQSRMTETIARRAPELASLVAKSETASPRTFARFVGRPAGGVGGVPRLVGTHNYVELSPPEVLDRVWLVGDSVFPGQSALAAAVGGLRASVAVARRLGS